MDFDEQPGRRPSVAGAAGWLHLLLVEIADFSELRRTIGVRRACAMMPDVAERAAALLPHASVSIAGRNLVEIGFASSDEATGREAGDSVRQALAGAICGHANGVVALIGVASLPVETADELALIERAEHSLAEARLSVPKKSEDRSITCGDSEVAAELRDAIARDELFVQYQPKLHVRKQRIASVEALIRWQHPARGLVMPNDFIPQAERSGVIAAMTLWTLRKVIGDQRILAGKGHDVVVYVNMAGALLSDAAFVEQVVATIGDAGTRVGIEITETSVIGDPDGAIRHLQRLAAMGVAVSIDDYGAGLSSLAYLKQLPATELKIDKLFVTQLTSSHRDPLIVRSTIDLAHAMEMEVVAEGVETPASLALLSVMGCDMVQGFLISRPLGFEALLAYLRDDGHLALTERPKSPFEQFIAQRSRG